MNSDIFDVFGCILIRSDVFTSIENNWSEFGEVLEELRPNGPDLLGIMRGRSSGAIFHLGSIMCGGRRFCNFSQKFFLF